MNRSIDKSKGLLFCSYDLQESLRHFVEDMKTEVAGVAEARFLNTAPADLEAYLVEKYHCQPLVLRRDEWYVETFEAQVDVQHDRNRHFSTHGRPFLVPGERVDVKVPYSGIEDLFYSFSDTFSSCPPRAAVLGQELILRYESPADSPRDIRPLVDHALDDIELHISWQARMIAAHNTALSSIAEAAIRERRDRLMAQSQRVAALGIPVRRAPNAPATYAVPTARRSARPVLPPSSYTSYVAEPIWAMEQYEHALKIMQDMALVMERSPAAFRAMDEEALRQHFLVQLNGQFEGKATAETFNMSGKTDILLREGDKNVFIAECKFWKGPKAFGDAIDQLLSYASWRDSKTAILVFNRDTSMSTVVSGADTTARAHANFKRAAAWPNESGFRYIFHANGDTNREIVVTVLIFSVPT